MSDVSGRLRRIIPTATAMAIATVAVAANSAATQTVPQPSNAPASQPANNVVIRGCLAGSKLTHVNPQDPKRSLPDTLKVSVIRVIRSQLKALDGHEVELIGTLRGVPGEEKGVLVVDSDKAKVYMGGGDTNLGEDFGISRIEPPTMYAHTIKDIAPDCTPARPK